MGRCAGVMVPCACIPRENRFALSRPFRGAKGASWHLSPLSLRRKGTRSAANAGVCPWRLEADLAVGRVLDAFEHLHHQALVFFETVESIFESVESIVVRGQHIQYRCE